MTIQKVKRKCKNCGKIFSFYPFPSQVKRGRGQFHNRACRMSFLTKGHTPWNKGAKGCFSKETIKEMSKNRSREKSNFWKGGRYKSKNGYIFIWKPNHPAIKHNPQIKYVREHRLVMEKYLGRYLKSWKTIHHKNGIKDDNRIENLELVVRNPEKVTSFHTGKVCCPKCKFEFRMK